MLQTNLSEMVYKRIEFTPIKPLYPVHHTVSYKPFDPEAIEYGNGITQRLWEKQYELCRLDLSNRNLTQAEGLLNVFLRLTLLINPFQRFFGCFQEGIEREQRHGIG